MPAWRNFILEIFSVIAGSIVLLVLYAIWDAAQTPSRLSATTDPQTLEATRKIEVVRADLYRGSGSNVYAEVVVKNANSFRVHDVQVSCRAFGADGRVRRTVQERFKRLRAHSLTKFRREKSFRHWDVSETVKCTVDAARLAAKAQ